MNPRGVASLCKNLYNASNNSTGNGFSGKFYEPAEITQRMFDNYMKQHCDA